MELKKKQVENILAGCNDLDAIEREFTIARKTGLTIPDELIKQYDYCRNRLESYKKQYVNKGSEGEKPQGERELLNVKRK